MFLVDSTGAKLPVRMVVGNLLQHLSPSNRTKILELMHSKGLSRGRAHLCSLTPAASEQVSSPVLLLENQTEEDQKQLQFILDYFQALPSVRSFIRLRNVRPG